MSLIPSKKAAPAKKVAKKQAEPKPEVYIVVETPKHDFIVVPPKGSERARYFPQSRPKGSKEVGRFSELHEANALAHKLASERTAKKEHKNASKPKMTTADFNFIAAMLRTMPIPAVQSTLNLNHVLAFMAESNPNFNAERFIKAVQSNG